MNSNRTVATKKAVAQKKEDSVIRAACRNGVINSDFLNQGLLAAKMVLFLVQEEHYGSIQNLVSLLGAENPTAMTRWFTKGSTPSRDNLLRLGTLIGIPEETSIWVNKIRFGTKIEAESWEVQFDELISTEKAQRLRENLRQRISEISASDWYRTVPLILDQLTLPDEYLMQVQAAVMSYRTVLADFKERSQARVGSPARSSTLAW